ncbi:MAG: endonuclease/exonuclease/phosphatase family protein [Deltaproteobacteria bacterium]|nr:endonuclease/exonuclease/phosphatase family protein [Deltaproteobacteria bacterium]
MRKAIKAARARRDPHAKRRAQIAERVPYLAPLRVPAEPPPIRQTHGSLEVATYNVHRFAGVRGGQKWNPDLAIKVIEELDSDIIGLQEVLRPFQKEDPLEILSDALNMHVAFAVTRAHRRGELGNAVLSRRPMKAVFTLDLNFGILERRSAVAAQFHGGTHDLTVVATHLALIDRTRERQVHSILDHPELQGPTLLLGDMNAWRQCRATKRLDDNFTTRHHNQNWQPTFPAPLPVLSLDRIYSRGVTVKEMRPHNTPAARRGSDHLPLVATLELGGFDMVERRNRGPNRLR